MMMGTESSEQTQTKQAQLEAIASAAIELDKLVSELRDRYLREYLHEGRVLPQAKCSVRPTPALEWEPISTESGAPKVLSLDDLSDPLKMVLAINALVTNVHWWANAAASAIEYVETGRILGQPLTRERTAKALRIGNLSLRWR
jgi:hypothetical protein